MQLPTLIWPLIACWLPSTVCHDNVPNFKYPISWQSLSFLHWFHDEGLLGLEKVNIEVSCPKKKWTIKSLGELDTGIFIKNCPCLQTHRAFRKVLTDSPTTKFFTSEVRDEHVTFWHKLVPYQLCQLLLAAVQLFSMGWELKKIIIMFWHSFHPFSFFFLYSTIIFWMFISVNNCINNFSPKLYFYDIISTLLPNFCFHKQLWTIPSIIFHLPCRSLCKKLDFQLLTFNQS